MSARHQFAPDLFGGPCVVCGAKSLDERLAPCPSVADLLPPLAVVPPSDTPGDRRWLAWARAGCDGALRPTLTGVVWFQDGDKPGCHGKAWVRLPWLDGPDVG